MASRGPQAREGCRRRQGGAAERPLLDGPGSTGWTGPRRPWPCPAPARRKPSKRGRRTTPSTPTSRTANLLDAATTWGCPACMSQTCSRCIMRNTVHRKSKRGPPRLTGRLTPPMDSPRRRSRPDRALCTRAQPRLTALFLAFRPFRHTSPPGRRRRPHITRSDPPLRRLVDWRQAVMRLAQFRVNRQQVVRGDSDRLDLRRMPASVALSGAVTPLEPNRAVIGAPQRSLRISEALSATTPLRPTGARRARCRQTCRCRLGVWPACPHTVQMPLSASQPWLVTVRSQKWPLPAATRRMRPAAARPASIVSRSPTPSSNTVVSSTGAALP